jgi:hypothetical protein
MTKIFNFLKTVILTNKVKLSIISISLILFYFCYTNIDETFVVHPLSSFQDNGKQVYIYKSGESYVDRSFDKPQKIVNGNLTFVGNSSGPTFGAVISVISLLTVLFIGVIAPDDDINWNFKDCWLKTVFKEVECDEEAGIYYYSYKGRLLCKIDHPDEYVIKRKLETILSVGENMFPRFEGTTQTKRDKRISEIIN